MAKVSKNRLPQCVVDDLANNMAEDMRRGICVGATALDTFLVENGFIKTSNIWVQCNDNTVEQIEYAFQWAVANI